MDPNSFIYNFSPFIVMSFLMITIFLVFLPRSRTKQLLQLKSYYNAQITWPLSTLVLNYQGQIFYLMRVGAKRGSYPCLWCYLPRRPHMKESKKITVTQEWHFTPRLESKIVFRYFPLSEEIYQKPELLKETLDEILLITRY
jgi:hypothetical protein